MVQKALTCIPGWITGHTYLSYGPLLCGATNVIYEGVPSYPSPARCWEIVEKYKARYLALSHQYPTETPKKTQVIEEDLL